MNILVNRLDIIGIILTKTSHYLTTSFRHLLDDKKSQTFLFYKEFAIFFILFCYIIISKDMMTLKLGYDTNTKSKDTVRIGNILKADRVIAHFMICYTALLIY